MDIIKASFDTSADKKLTYKLTKSSGMMVQDAPAGLSVPVKEWALYNDPKEQKDGSFKENKVLSFLDPAGVKYSTISTTFIREFLDIAQLMASEAFAVILVHGTTNGGKPFVTCELDCDYNG